MHKDDNNLPVFGIGPVYVLSCFVVTALGLALDYNGKLGFGKVSACKTVAFIIGILLIIVGAALWVCTVLIQRIGASIKEGKLITRRIFFREKPYLFGVHYRIYRGFDNGGQLGATHIACNILGCVDSGTKAY